MTDVSWAVFKGYVPALHAAQSYINANCSPRWKSHAIKGEEIAPAIGGWVGVLMDDDHVWRGYVWADKVEMFE